MSDHAFERALGRIAVVGSDFGANCAYLAILDLLERHKQHEARDIVEAYGRESIDLALRAEAWRAEQEPLSNANGTGNPANANGTQGKT